MSEPTTAAAITRLVWRALGIPPHCDLDRLDRETFEEMIQQALDTGKYPTLQEKR